MKKIRKAVFPVAGFGSRFLPATKAQPKEMLPIVDKPLIQYAVEEAIAAGIDELIFITGRGKRAIEDHFDKAYELETELNVSGKLDLLERIQNIIPPHVSCIFIRQSKPLGLGHAVLCARPIVGDEPFAVLLADDFMDVYKSESTVIEQMIEVYEKEESNVLAIQPVPRTQTKQYGVVKASPYRQGLEHVSAIVEKPTPAKAPSNLAVMGRYVFMNGQIFDCLEVTPAGSGGEIQLTDGIAALIAHQRVLAYRYHGRRYDCGSKIGYLKAMVAIAMKHPEVKQEFMAYLDEINQTSQMSQKE